MHTHYTRATGCGLEVFCGNSAYRCGCAPLQKVAKQWTTDCPTAVNAHNAQHTETHTHTEPHRHTRAYGIVSLPHAAAHLVAFGFATFFFFGFCCYLSACPLVLSPWCWILMASCSCSVAAVDKRTKILKQFFSMLLFLCSLYFCFKIFRFVFFLIFSSCSTANVWNHEAQKLIMRTGLCCYKKYNVKQMNWRCCFFFFFWSYCIVPHSG